MPERCPVFCENAELVLEASTLADRLELAVAVELTADPLSAAAHDAKQGRPACAVCVKMPEAAALVEALDVCSGRARMVLCALSAGDAKLRGLALDLGIACVDDVEPALASLALLAHGLAGELKGHARKLSINDRARTEGALSDRAAARLSSIGPDGVAAEVRESSSPVRLGHARATAQALTALRASDMPPAGQASFPVDAAQAAREVLFGPPRLLSDPASKLALSPFGLPMPQEELCTSASRAAAEAGRIGFPVRISLASPDLRVWDHPDLSIDGVDNAARVRDVYRQLEGLARERAREARILGVTVTATTLARALVRLSARKLPHGRVLLRIGFADPHGAVARDAILTALPATPEALERALMRLDGHALILADGGKEREAQRDAFADLCARVCAFVHAFRDEVQRVDLHPVALLVGGGAEVREAAVEVTDAFSRELA